jgi:hypothetical protein
VSNRAREYVSELRPQEVTRTEKLVMTAIAEEYSDRYGSANVPSEDISDYAMISKRQFRRVMASLQRKGLVKYTPGKGNGVYCSFVLTNLALGAQEVVGIEAGKSTKRGHKGDIKRTFPTPLIRKEDQNQDQSQKLNAFDLRSATNDGEILSASSSARTDDDIERKIARVLETYRESPVTTGNTNAADEAMARSWLSNYTQRQIENGIILATARRMSSVLSTGAHPAPVRSLKYFHDAVQEAKTDPNCTESYIINCERAIERLAKEWKKPMGVAAG